MCALCRNFVLFVVLFFKHGGHRENFTKVTEKRPNFNGCVLLIAYCWLSSTLYFLPSSFYFLLAYLKQWYACWLILNAISSLHDVIGQRTQIPWQRTRILWQRIQIHWQRTQIHWQRTQILWQSTHVIGLFTCIISTITFCIIPIACQPLMKMRLIDGNLFVVN